MADKKKLNLGDFYCTVSSNGQIFVPVRMREVMDIAANDEVKFSFQDDGSVKFSKDSETSKENQNQGKKDKEDGEKRNKALK